MTAPLISERVTCCHCTATFSQSALQLAAITLGWIELEGFRFCWDCAPAAPYIVALDRAVNRHQVTLLKLDEAFDRAATTITGQSAGELNQALTSEVERYPDDRFDASEERAEATATLSQEFVDSLSSDDLAGGAP